MGARRFQVLLALAVGLFAWPVRAEPAGRPFLPEVDVRLKFQGLDSCASKACHGSPVPAPATSKIRRDEYSLWVTKDRHARAHFTLTNEKSQRMLRRLGADLGALEQDPQYQNCLGCHAPTKWPGAPASVPPGVVEGVSCEACHGPAEKWQTAHYERDWSHQNLAAFGMVDTKNVLVRARICADCHVGSPDREVNHDLLAAGHPVLKFELSAYLAMMPKHWDDSGERKKSKNLELTLWAAGQVAAADARLELLAARAAGTSRLNVWPELAEYNCFGCHHDLTAAGWRPGRQHATGKQLLPAWDAWYFPLLEVWSPNSEPLDKFKTSLTEVRTGMSGSLLPDRKESQRRAEFARDRLRECVPTRDGRLGVFETSPVSLFELIVQRDHLSHSDGPSGHATMAEWDVATQMYLALFALDVAKRDEVKAGRANALPEDALLREGHQKLRATLANQAQFNNPGDFVGLAANAKQQAAAREDFRRELAEIFKQIRERMMP